MALKGDKLAKITNALESGKIPHGLAIDEETRNVVLVALQASGVDVRLLSRKLKEGLSADKTFSVEETLFLPNGEPRLDSFGKPMNVKRKVVAADYWYRLKYIEFIFSLLQPKENKPEQTNQAGGTADDYLLVPKELLGLKGQALTDAFMARSRAIANGLPPPEIPESEE